MSSPLEVKEPLISSLDVSGVKRKPSGTRKGGTDLLVYLSGSLTDVVA